MARLGRRNAMKVGIGTAVSYYLAWSGQDRQRSGVGEADRENDLGHAEEPINVNCDPAREAVARNGAFENISCPPLPRRRNKDES